MPSSDWLHHLTMPVVGDFQLCYIIGHTEWLLPQKHVFHYLLFSNCPACKTHSTISTHYINLTNWIHQICDKTSLPGWFLQLLIKCECILRSMIKKRRYWLYRLQYGTYYSQLTMTRCAEPRQKTDSTTVSSKRRQAVDKARERPNRNRQRRKREGEDRKGEAEWSWFITNSLDQSSLHYGSMKHWTGSLITSSPGIQTWP